MEGAVEHEQHPPQAKNKNVADRVAARYAKAPTYSEMLANEARNVARAAEAAAVAAGEARDAAQAILVGLDIDRDAKDFAEPETSQLREPSASRASNGAPRGSETSSRLQSGYRITEAVEDDEISDEAEPIAPIQPLPAKLLEFPRELVAARKARPRLAEGPLREEYDRDASASQLRIFEVEQETISTAPAVEHVQPDWSPIRLDTSPALPVHDWISRHAETPAPEKAKDYAPASSLELPLQTASLEDRLMAGLVDAALIIGGFLVFVLVFVGCYSASAGRQARDDCRRGSALRFCGNLSLALLQLWHRHAGNALRQDRAVHLRRRESKPECHASPSRGDAALRDPIRPGHSVGVLR